MPVEGDRLYHTREEVVNDILARWQEIVPDLWLGEDGNVRIFTEIYAGVAESVYQALEIFSEDMYIVTANVQALQLYGTQYGNPQKVGQKATGFLLFEGAGGTFVPISTEAAYDSGTGIDPLYFVTTSDDSIPNPGIPTAPNTADSGVTGNPNGSFQYVITFVTAQGETLPGTPSAARSVASKKINLTAIPIGGLGTIARRVYRDKNAAGTYKLVATISDNTATTYQDDIPDASLGVAPPTISTAERVLIAAEGEDFGFSYNVAPLTVTELVDAPDGVVDVSNPAPFTGGADPEDIEMFRDRLLTTVRGPGSGSETDLKRWAEEVEGVTVATVFSNDNVGTPTNGHATIRISGPDGDVPGASVVADVANVLADKDMANITLHVTTFIAVPTSVSVTVSLDPDISLTDVQQSAVDAISDYIQGLEVGETMYLTGIIAAVVGLPGISDVAVTLPGANQTTPASSKRVPNVITVS